MSSSDKKLKRPLMFMAGILILASLLLPLWSLTMTGDLIWGEEELGEMSLVLSADHYDVNLNMTLTIDEESVSESATIQYANLNYTAESGDWLFGDDNETVPADTVTQYIYPIVPVMSLIAGVMMLGLAFVTPEKQRWIVIVMLILAILTMLYFWYAWDLFLNHLNMNFFSEVGVLLDLPTGVTVTGNPAWGFYLIIASVVLAIVSVIRDRKNLFVKSVE